MRLTSDWSRISAASAINRTAAVVTAGSEVEGSFRRPPHDCWHARVPPQTISPRYFPDVATGFEDLTGRQTGRLTVIGYLGKQNPKKKARWLVRCACGDYEVRHAAAIKAAASGDDCCWNCGNVKAMRNGGHKR